LDQAAGYQQDAVALFREIGDRGGEAEALNGAGDTLLATGQPAKARACYVAALVMARRAGDRYQQGLAHHGQALACQAMAQPARARQHRQLALDLYTSLGVPEAGEIDAIGVSAPA
jgi:tetratricopeptide (TPR) repeat protein